MKLLYTSKPENRGGLKLAFFLFFIILIIGILVYEERLLMVGLGNFFDYFMILMICMVVIFFLLYLLDEAFWQMFGVEICEYDISGIRITKKSIVKKTKFIRWNEISNISEAKTHPIWKVVTYFSLAGIPQDKIAIYYGHRKVYTCGTNLSIIQIRETLDLTHKMIEEQRKKNNPVVPDLQSGTPLKERT